MPSIIPWSDTFLRYVLSDNCTKTLAINGNKLLFKKSLLNPITDKLPPFLATLNLTWFLSLPILKNWVIVGSEILKIGCASPVPNGPTWFIWAKVCGDNPCSGNSMSYSLVSSPPSTWKLLSNFSLKAPILSSVIDRPHAKSCPPNLVNKSSFNGFNALNKLKPVIDLPEPLISPASFLVKTIVGLWVFSTILLATKPRTPSWKSGSYKTRVFCFCQLFLRINSIHWS